MRKVSKSKIDDDVASSSDGSFTKEESNKKDTNGASDIAADVDADVANGGSDSELETTEDLDSKEPPKKKAKGKAKKKSTGKKAVEEEYEVEKVIDSKKIKGKLHYLIRWKGYKANNDTWEPENTLSCSELIQQYQDKEESSKVEKVGKSPNSKKRKKNSKTEPKAKRSKELEWDSENADEDAEYEVERILEVHHKKNGEREFLIHWKGWATKYDSWEPESHLNCSDLIEKFMAKVSTARSTDSRTLRVAPGTTQRFTLQTQASERRLSKRRGQQQRVRYDDAD